MAKQFGEKIKELREAQGLLQRQVASTLDIDAPLFSKIERGERVAKKELISKLAEILKTDKEQLLTLWLADQVFDVVKNEDVADEALKSVSLTINSDKKKKQ
jgi:transcriptional regulator with XRE-family HTH domain